MEELALASKLWIPQLAGLGTPELLIILIVVLMVVLGGQLLLSAIFRGPRRRG